MRWVVQYRVRTGEDWGDPKTFEDRELARAHLRQTLREARPEAEGHLLKV